MQAVPSDRPPALFSAPEKTQRSRSRLPLVAVALVAALTLLGKATWEASELSAPKPVHGVQSPPVEPPASAPPVANPPLPTRLSETGLYVPGSTSEVDPENLPYVPQYPLWTDGAEKRRFVRLPKGARIDAANPDAWEFPVGTRFWKEFSFSGKPAETRTIERLPDGSFRYATYVWDAAQDDAFLAPESGRRAVAPIAAGIEHDVPSEYDCRACHEGRPGRVLGFNALQLSSDRDPLAAHREAPPEGALTLDDLVRRGWLANLPPEAYPRAPRISAPSAKARAALGYLYGNCAHCHHPTGTLAELDLDLDHGALDADGEARTLASVARSSHFRIPGEAASFRVHARRPQASTLFFRLTSRDPLTQMPPLGSKLVDPAGAALVRAWISSLPHRPRQ